MIFALLTVTTAIGLSGIAAYYSIIGLTAIFSGEVIPVAIMGSILEISKLICASWLYRNWKTSPILLKSYLTFATVILMVITSLGIFGFLSRAHVQQLGSQSTIQGEIQILNNDINIRLDSNEKLNLLLDQLDAAFSRYVELGAVSKGLEARKEQESEREYILSELKINNDEIKILTNRRNELQLKLTEIEVEFGPIKYISEFLFNEENQNLDRAVRYVIILLILVFDPLAILLLISGNISLNELKKRNMKKKKQSMKEDPSSINRKIKTKFSDVTIPKENIQLFKP